MEARMSKILKQTRAGRLVCRLVVPGELEEGGLAAVEARLSPWATER